MWNSLFICFTGWNPPKNFILVTSFPVRKVLKGFTFFSLFCSILGFVDPAEINTSIVLPVIPMTRLLLPKQVYRFSQIYRSLSTPIDQPFFQYRCDYQLVQLSLFSIPRQRLYSFPRKQCLHVHFFIVFTTFANIIARKNREWEWYRCRDFCWGEFL